MNCVKIRETVLIGYVLQWSGCSLFGRTINVMPVATLHFTVRVASIVTTFLKLGFAGESCYWIWERGVCRSALNKLLSFCPVWRIVLKRWAASHSGLLLCLYMWQDVGANLGL